MYGVILLHIFNSGKKQSQTTPPHYPHQNQDPTITNHALTGHVKGYKDQNS